MRLRIRSEDVELCRESRAMIDRNFRIALGTRCGQVAEARIVFGRPVGSPDLVSCRITLKPPEGASTRVEETAAERDTAMDWAIWRLKRRLDRQALRAPAPDRPVTGSEAPGRR